MKSEDIRLILDMAGNLLEQEQKVAEYNSNCGTKSFSTLKVSNCQHCKQPLETYTQRKQCSQCKSDCCDYCTIICKKCGRIICSDCVRSAPDGNSGVCDCCWHELKKQQNFQNALVIEEIFFKRRLATLNLKLNVLQQNSTNGSPFLNKMKQFKIIKTVGEIEELERQYKQLQNNENY